MTGPGDVPAAVLDRLRPICGALPDAYEEPAWIGVRWRIRMRTFAHVYVADPDRRQAYALGAATDEPLCVMTFRAPGDEFDGLIRSGHPFFRPGWGSDVVGMVIEEDIDWEEVAELLTESYCIRAPKRLAALVDRPAGG